MSTTPDEPVPGPLFGTPIHVDRPPQPVKSVWPDPEKTIKILEEQRTRQNEVIAAMQRRQSRNPVREFFWRKPWRAPHGIGLRGFPIRSWPFNFWQWLCNAHDCSDPAVGCSCYGGYRFPKVEE